MWKLILFGVGIWGCGFPKPADVKNTAVPVGGTVHGMWTGAEGVALRLTADGVDTLYSVSSNGPFSFPTTLAEGASYVVDVAANPGRHTCAVTAGANGIVPAVGVTTIDVACVGPAVSIALSAPAPWKFDASVDVQPTLNTSLALQAVTLTISNSDGLVSTARVTGSPVVLGLPSAPQPLSLGTNTISVDLAAQGGLSKTYQIPINRGAGTLEQSAYVKASNTAPRAYFGYSVAVSGDTIAVGAYGDTNSTGAVYVFQRNGATWTQQAYLRASNAEPGDQFGSTVALDGDTLAVGASTEASKATGINGDQTDNSVTGAGAVYVFQRSGTTWSQQAYVKSSITPSHGFGYYVALSGNTLAATATNDVSVFVFQRTGTTWTQQARIDGTTASPAAIPDNSFGHALSLSGDTLAIGAPYQDFSNYAGAVYIYQRNGATWTQQAYLREQIAGINDFFGGTLSLVNDTLVVGASGEDSAATGINGNESDDSADGSGAVYVFQRTGTSWVQQTYIKASNTDKNDSFGATVAFSGELLAIGASGESGGSTGVGGDQSDNSKSNSGAVYLFRKDGPSWKQQSYIKASNTGTGDFFSTVALSGDTLVVGAYSELSGATGINGNQMDDSTVYAGAVYVFR